MKYNKNKILKRIELYLEKEKDIIRCYKTCKDGSYNMAMHTDTIIIELEKIKKEIENN